MEKPEPKKEVAIQDVGPNTRTIFFNASFDAVEDFREFGFISRSLTSYMLIVDARYDFEEVVQYIENYG